MSDKVPLGDLTKLGLFFGRVSEVHIKNLQSFPFIYFNDLKEAKLDYDIGSTREDKSLVTYDLIMTTENDLLPKRYAALETAVRSVFWKDMPIKILINGKEVYKSE